MGAPPVPGGRGRDGRETCGQWVAASAGDPARGDRGGGLRGRSAAGGRRDAAERRGGRAAHREPGGRDLEGDGPRRDAHRGVDGVHPHPAEGAGEGAGRGGRVVPDHRQGRERGRAPALQRGRDGGRVGDEGSGRRHEHHPHPVPAGEEPGARLVPLQDAAHQLRLRPEDDLHLRRRLRRHHAPHARGHRHHGRRARGRRGQRQRGQLQPGEPVGVGRGSGARHAPVVRRPGRPARRRRRVHQDREGRPGPRRVRRALLPRGGAAASPRALRRRDAGPGGRLLRGRRRAAGSTSAPRC